MNRSFNRVSTQFAVPVTGKEWSNILKRAQTQAIGDTTVGVRTAITMIREIDGVSTVEYRKYNANHCILVTLKHYDDHTLHAISEIINREGKDLQ